MSKETLESLSENGQIQEAPPAHSALETGPMPTEGLDLALGGLMLGLSLTLEPAVKTATKLTGLRPAAVVLFLIALTLTLVFLIRVRHRLVTKLVGRLRGCKLWVGTFVTEMAPPAGLARIEELEKAVGQQAMEIAALKKTHGRPAEQQCVAGVNGTGRSS